MYRKREPISLDSIGEEYQKAFELMKTITVPWNSDFKVKVFDILRKTISKSSGTFYGEMLFIDKKEGDKEITRVSRFSIRIMNKDWKIKEFNFVITLPDGKSKSIELKIEKDSSILTEILYKDIKQKHPGLEDKPVMVFSYNDFDLYKKHDFAGRSSFRRYCAFLVKHKDSEDYRWIWISKLETTRGNYYKWKYATWYNPMPLVEWTPEELQSMSQRKKKKTPETSDVEIKIDTENAESALPKVIDAVNKDLSYLKLHDPKIITVTRIGMLYLYIVTAITKNGEKFKFLMMRHENTIRYIADTYPSDAIDELVAKTLFTDANSKEVKL